MRILVTGLVLGVLIVGAVVLVPTSRAEDEEFGPPKLVWERTFEKNILAAGVDDERFAQAKEDFSSLLKWILFDGRMLGQYDKSGAARVRADIGQVYAQCISANGKYLVAVRAEEEWWKKRNGIHYKLLDWDGRVIWQVSYDIYMWPLVWDDGSAAFPIVASADPPRLGGIRFYSAKGRMTNEYRFPGARKISSRFVGKSGKFLVVGSTVAQESHEIHVFDKTGKLRWGREAIESWWTDSLGTRFRCSFAGVTVSDRGEVVLLLYRWDPFGYNVLVYDGKGDLQDNLVLHPTGALNPLISGGDFAFISTGGLGSRLLCYDLADMKIRFLVEEEQNRRFWNFEVDVDAGLIAVAVHSESGGDVVRFYDFDGEYKTELPVEVSRRSEFWFKLLPGALLVAEKNSLRLYALKRDE